MNCHSLQTTNRSRFIMTQNPRVTVESGVLEGYVVDNETEPGKSYFCFQGIPYAKPPLGDLRFKVIYFCQNIPLTEYVMVVMVNDQKI